MATANDDYFYIITLDQHLEFIHCFGIHWFSVKMKNKKWKKKLAERIFFQLYLN